MKIASNIFLLTIIVLWIIGLKGNVDSKEIKSYMLISLGILNTFKGIRYYKQGKKADGIMFLLSSIFVLGVVVSTFVI